MIKAIVFDLGDTLIKQRIDSSQRLDEMRLRLLPHAKDALRRLHRKYRIGILTNTSKSRATDVAKALVRLSIAQYVDTIVTSVDVGCEKPHHEMFRVILRKLRVSVKQCVMVGNDYDHDIRPAIRMGIRTIHLQSGATHGTSGYVTITSLAQLAKQISQMEGASK